MKTTFIYILIDPLTNQLRYVGKANNPLERYKNHKNKCRDVNTHKRNWINKLTRLNLSPEMEVIDEVLISEWKYWEKFWVGYYKYIGCNLLNYTTGGDGLSFGNQTSFKKGQKPHNQGLKMSSLTKEKIRQAHLGKKVSEETRLRMSKSMRGKNRGAMTLDTKEKIKHTFFKKGLIPHNKGKSGYKLTGLRTSRPVIQLDMKGNVIAEFLGCKEAAWAMGCTGENIRKVCIGKSKTAKRYLWKFKMELN